MPHGLNASGIALILRDLEGARQPSKRMKFNFARVSSLEQRRRDET
jgi:hypothetical protein